MTGGGSASKWAPHALLDAEPSHLVHFANSRQGFVLAPPSCIQFLAVWVSRTLTSSESLKTSISGCDCCCGHTPMATKLIRGRSKHTTYILPGVLKCKQTKTFLFCVSSHQTVSNPPLTTWDPRRPTSLVLPIFLLADHGGSAA